MKILLFKVRKRIRISKLKLWGKLCSPHSSRLIRFYHTRTINKICKIKSKEYLSRWCWGIIRIDMLRDQKDLVMVTVLKIRVWKASSWKLRSQPMMKTLLNFWMWIIHGTKVVMNHLHHFWHTSKWMFKKFKIPRDQPTKVLTPRWHPKEPPCISLN